MSDRERKVGKTSEGCLIKVVINEQLALNPSGYPVSQSVECY